LHIDCDAGRHGSLGTRACDFEFWHEGGSLRWYNRRERYRLSATGAPGEESPPPVVRIVWRVFRRRVCSISDSFETGHRGIQTRTNPRNEKTPHPAARWYAEVSDFDQTPTVPWRS
jgi:hypothetical protein